MTSTPARNRYVRPVLTMATLLFIATFFVLVLRGGQCERYERRMARRDAMRSLIDSARRQSQPAPHRHDADSVSHR